MLGDFYVHSKSSYNKIVNKTYNNILIVKYKAMGDSIIGLSSCQYFKDLFPNSKVTYATTKWTAPLYKNSEGSYDSIYPLDLNTISGFLAFYSYLKSNQFDLVFELSQATRTKRFFFIYTLLNNLNYKFHNHHLKTNTGIIDQGINKAIIQRDLDGIYSLVSDNKNYPNFLNYVPTLKLKTQKKENKVILGVVATRETKQWPLDNFIDLALLINHKYNSQVIIPLSKSDEDQKIKLYLEKKNHSFIKILQSSLDLLIGNISDSLVYIGNDTGLKHLSVAINIPTITLFGPEQPEEWHPYDNKNHPYLFIENEKMPCRVENNHYCGLSFCEHHSCMKNITPEDILEVISKKFNTLFNNDLI